MGLLSIFKRKGAPASSAEVAGDAGSAVQRARTRARQRLIGAVVLVAIGIIGFPLVFETQPRPIPVDIPIEIPRKETAAPLTMPPARPSAADASARPAPDAAPSSGEVITESREDGGREVAATPTPASPTPASPSPVSPSLVPPANTAASRPAVTAAAPPVKASVPAPTEAARAQALLEGKSGKPVGDGRFVVQVGAFADAGAAHETRLKVERLGMKTYTQVANTAGGNRIRVRVGPFGSRLEADKALAKARSAGLTAVVLTL